jgi:dephospho-CoA kinase
MSTNNWRLGLAGGLGSGKTAATDYFAQKGIEIIDTDLIAREVVSPGQTALTEIQAHFGDEALLEDGNLNRAWLRQRVFEAPEERRWLEQVTHPRIRALTLKRLDEARSDYAILVAPLFFESGMESLVDRTLLIDVPVAVQIARASSRDQADPEHIQAIIKAQMSRSDRQRKADDIVENTGTLETLYQSLDLCHQSYLERAAIKLEEPSSPEPPITSESTE